MVKLKRPSNAQDYKNYIESSSWKCPKSPTGAHHWMGSGTEFQCKYCGEERIYTYNPKMISQITLSHRITNG